MRGREKEGKSEGEGERREEGGGGRKRGTVRGRAQQVRRERE